MQVLQDKTKRMSDLLSEWAQGSKLEVSAQIHNPLQVEYNVQGGTELEAVMALGIAQICSRSGFQSLVNLEFREFDYFLRDSNSVPAFDKEHEKVFNCIKGQFCEAIVESRFQANQHQLVYQNLFYHAALKSYCYQAEISPELVELVDIEDDLVVVKLREGLDKPHQRLDEIMEHYSKLFQDSEINVIPE